MLSCVCWVLRIFKNSRVLGPSDFHEFTCIGCFGYSRIHVYWVHRNFTKSRVYFGFSRIHVYWVLRIFTNSRVYFGFSRIHVYWALRIFTNSRVLGASDFHTCTGPSNSSIFPVPYSLSRPSRVHMKLRPGGGAGIARQLQVEERQGYLHQRLSCLKRSKSCWQVTLAEQSDARALSPHC